MNRIFTLVLFSIFGMVAQSQCFLVPTEVCQGACGPLFYLQNDPDGTTYQWSISCGTITNDMQANPHTVCFEEAGICTIQVIIEIPGEDPDTCSMMVEVLPYAYTEISENICESDSVEINGIYYTPGIYTDTIFGASADGCDSILLITVSAIPNDTTVLDLTACEGDGFHLIINGNVYDESNPSGTETLEGSDGCDSVLVINIIFLENTSFDYIYFGCQGDSFSIVINNVVYNEVNPTGVEIIAAANGCDSVVSISLSFFPHVYDTITYDGCAGDGFSILIGDTEYNESNPTGIDTIPGGCDTIVVIDLHFDTIDASFILEGDQLCVSPGGLQYTWMTCDGIQLPGTEECITVSGPGCVCVIIDNGMCMDTICYEYEVCEVFCEIISPEGICLGDSVLLSAFVFPDTAFISWRITIDSANVLQFTGSDSIWVTINTTGCFAIDLEVEAYGCTSICTDTICVAEKPLADLCCNRISCDTCTSLELHFFGTPPWTVAISDGDAIDTLSGITASLYEHIVCPPSNHLVNYTLLWVSDQNGFCEGGIINDSVTVYLESQPEAVINITENTICAGPLGFVYNWSNCDQTIHYSGDQCFSPPATGCYCVTVSSLLTDCVDTACVDFVLVGVEEETAHPKIRVWYDPGSHAILIQGFTAEATDVSIGLYDPAGRRIPFPGKSIIGEGIISLQLPLSMPPLSFVNIITSQFNITKGIFIPAD